MNGWSRPLAPVDPVDTIPVAGPKAQRNREYEKTHPVFVIRVRDASIREKILGFSQSLCVPADDVARAFLEAGLDAAEKGKIDLSGIRVTRGRMSLYPTGTETWKVHDEPIAWSFKAGEVHSARPRTTAEKNAVQKERNKQRLAYRLPSTTLERFQGCYLAAMGIESEAELARHEGRKGEFFLTLLEFGLKKYQSGQLPLTPQVVVVKARLK